MGLHLYHGISYCYVLWFVTMFSVVHCCQCGKSRQNKHKIIKKGIGMFLSNNYSDKTWMGYEVKRTNACLSFYSFKSAYTVY